MEDARIVDLYWERSENAISETSTKYGKYCYSIAYGILTNAEDADESVNDTYLDAWNAMPPHRPSILSTFLGKITRRLSIDKWRIHSAGKRGGGELPLVLDELQDCIASSTDLEEGVEQRELIDAINGFLSRLPINQRDVFVSRYWFISPVRKIAQKFDMSESNVKTMLFRTRQKLFVYLREEGYR